MGGPYAVQCLYGTQKGDWYRRHGRIIRLTSAKAAALAGTLNRMGPMWLATRFHDAKPRLETGEVAEQRKREVGTTTADT